MARFIKIFQVLLLGIIITGCDLFPLEKEPLSQTEIVSLSGSEIQITADDDNIFQSAINAADQKLCLDLKNEELKKLCIKDIIYTLAIKNKDEEYCKQFDADLEEENMCREFVAHEITDIDENEKNQVILDKALKARDITLCAEILNEEARRICNSEFIYNLAIKKKDLEYCQTFDVDSGFSKDDCADLILFEIVYDKSTDENICQQFSEQKKIDCLNTIYENNALRSADTSWCAKITTLQKKERCVKRVDFFVTEN